ncbi:MAG: hypothetical protein J5858_01415 [Lentisphaeria bacterium]|nr:hypothetical protein [Lentisphaeria bacterium]
MSEYIVGLKYWSYFTAWLPHKTKYYRVSAKNEDEAQEKAANLAYELDPTDDYREMKIVEVRKVK